MFVLTTRKPRVTAALAVALAMLANGCANDDTVEPLGQSTDTETTSEAGGEATDAPSETETATKDATADGGDAEFSFASASEGVRHNLQRANWLPLDQVSRRAHPYVEWANSPSADHEVLWDQMLDLTVYSAAAERLRETILPGSNKGWPNDVESIGVDKFAAHGFLGFDLSKTASISEKGHVVVPYATTLIRTDDAAAGVREETWMFPVHVNEDITEIIAVHPPIRTITADGYKVAAHAMPTPDEFTPVDEYDPSQVTPVPPPPSPEPTETKTVQSTESPAPDQE